MERANQGLEEQHDPSCPFCRIARSEDRSVEIICEGLEWVAFFPPEPATRGHTLVIPRVHVRELWSIEPILGAALMEVVLKVGHALNRSLSPEGMNLISSSGEAAEQSVFHLHLHVVPRWRNDEIGKIWPPKRELEPEVKEKLADAVRQACRESA